MKAPSLAIATSIFLLSMLCLYSISIQAQDKKVALGLGISPAVNWLSTDAEGMSSDGSKIGFSYGLLADFNFGENYALASGLMINSFGGKTNETRVDTSGSQNVKMNYSFQSILIPITLRMRTKEIGYLRYYGQFGFNPEFIINSRADVNPDGSDEQTDVGIMSTTADMNLSLVLGVGIMYNLSGTTNFIVGLSYHNGFVDMINGTIENGGSLERRATSNQIALNLGVLF